MKVSNVILFVLLLTSIEAYSQKVAFTRTIGNTTISTKVTLPKKQPNIANSQSIPQGKVFNLDYKSKELTSCVVDFNKKFVFVGTTLDEAFKLTVSELKNHITAYTRIIDDIESKL